MMERKTLNKLPPEVVNQIAAGEVIERPASVVKELVDNAIDAQASKIIVKVIGGGIDMIEVQDNGFGIPKENLPLIFEPHTTSKIHSIEDLNTLMSMGFRGEALSTITSVAKVKLDSKYVEEDTGNSISFDESGIAHIVSAPKESGTTVKVENIFYNIPARRKFLKSSATEFRKIYDILVKYYLIYPNIHFVLYRDGKIIDDIKNINGSSAGEIEGERVKEVLGEHIFNNMLKVFSEGAGIKVGGYIAHPSTHNRASKHQFIFLNSRPISDRGVAGSVISGYSRYIPAGERVDFIINIKINPELVDVNVHPRKEEVRFENPYRVYSAVEEAVKHALESNLLYLSEQIFRNENVSPNFSALRDRLNANSSSQKYESHNYELPIRNFNHGLKEGYTPVKNFSVRDSIVFSSEVLKQTNEEIKKNSENFGDIISVHQIFNKYIVVEYENEICWVVDQHAGAERINFEKLVNRESQKKNLQHLLVPVTVPLNKEEVMFLKENKKFFESIGFVFDISNDEKGIILKTVPAEYAESDFESIFREIFKIDDNISELRKSFDMHKEDILATIACHGSIRSGQKLTKEEMFSFIDQLKKCKNPYSCPHGRPIVWELKLQDIDSHFERTY